MTTEKSNKPLAIIIFLTFALQACTSSNPRAYDQAPVRPEVMGIADTVKLKADYHGVFYYINDNGKVTGEPVFLSSKRCAPQQYRGNRRGVLGVYDSMTQDEDLIAAIELQCKTRREWEQDNKQRIQRERIYGYKRR